MTTLTQSPDSTTDPLPPPGGDPPPITPYFRRLAAYREAFDQAAAGRGLPPRSWAA